MFFTLLGIAVLNAAIGYGVGYCVGAFVDEFFLTDAIEEAYPDAFKILIKEKKKNAVNVGIFNKSDYEIKSDVKIEAQEGVADSIYIGQVIYV